MATHFQDQEPRRLTVLRFSVRNLDSLGDRAAYWLLMASWFRYLSVLVAGYASAGTLFAIGFLLIGRGPKEPAVCFADCFVMSLQALTVFGSGRLVLEGSLAKVFAASALFTGWLALLVVLSLTMARFIHLRPLWRSRYEEPLAEKPIELPTSRPSALN